MRYFVDVMTGVPSIMFGLFIYIVLVLAHIGGSFAAWKGSVAISLLMLPIVIRSSEVVLLLVPDSLREAALALGAPRWRVLLRVVLPTAAPGLLTGSLLAVARGMGETAPLLFTVCTAFGLTGNLGGADEHAALPDLHRHPVAALGDRGAGLGRRADPGGLWCSSSTSQLGPLPEGAAWHDQPSDQEQGASRRVHGGFPR